MASSIACRCAGHRAQVIAVATLRGKLGDGAFDHDAQFEDVAQFAELRAGALPEAQVDGLRRFDHESARTLAGLDQAVGLESRDGFTDHGAADAKGFAQGFLRRQAVAGFQLAARDATLQFAGHFLRKPQGPRDAAQFGARFGARLGTLLEGWRHEDLLIVVLLSDKFPFW
jgi:hypothetical protein